MTPAWLLLALDSALPELVGADRDRLAQVICEQLPGPDMAAVIASSAAAVLKTHGISGSNDIAGRISREIGNNAAQCLLGALADDDVMREVNRRARGRR